MSNWYCIIKDMINACHNIKTYADFFSIAFLNLTLQICFKKQV